MSTRNVSHKNQHNAHSTLTRALRNAHLVKESKKKAKHNQYFHKLAWLTSYHCYEALKLKRQKYKTNCLRVDVFIMYVVQTCSTPDRQLLTMGLHVHAYTAYNKTIITITINRQNI